MNNPQIIYYTNGQKWYEVYRNGKCEFHRENGPAFITWFINGQIKSETYYISGKKYREDGPAYIYWNENGQKCYEEYWINDVKLDKFQLRKLKLEKLKLL